MTFQVASSIYPDEPQKIEDEIPKIEIHIPPEEISAGSQETDDTKTDANTLKPGARLHYAREQKNLSIQHVADRLYLDSGVIKALETDNYESLPSSIFVRGYLRNYAKVLEIPPDPILEAYDLITGKKPTASVPMVIPQGRPKMQASSNDSWVKAISLTVVIVCIIFMALWQMAPNTSSPPPEEPKTVPLDLGKSPPASSSPSAPAGENIQPTPLSGGTSSEVPIPPPGSLTTPITAPVSGPGDGKPTPLVTAPVAEGGTTTSETTPAAVESDPNTIKVSSKKNTWLRVIDKTNKTLYDGVSKEDDEVVSVTGTPPFKVKVGRVEGVSVDYLGQKTDFVALPNRLGKSKKEAIIGATPN